MTREMRRAVHNYGCGWRECPECGPFIELEIEAEHRKKVESTYASELPENRMSGWLGDVYGTGEQRRRPVITPEERRAARGTRAEYREKVRVKRTLVGEDRKTAFSLLATRPVARTFLRDGRAVWESEVWLELTNPTKLVAERERRMSITRRFDRAVHRAERLMHLRYREEARLVAHPEMDRK